MIKAHLKVPIYLIVLVGVLKVAYASTFISPVLDSRTEKGSDGSTTTYLFHHGSENCFEVKVTDRNGKITQWYQHYLDCDGKEIIEIDKVLIGENKPSYDGVQLIKTFQYNQDKNLTESYEFFGDGTLRIHVIYKYDSKGNWTEGDIYGVLGQLIGKELTPPEAHLYGIRRK